MYRITFFSLGDSLGGAEQLMFHLAKKHVKEVKICIFGNKTNTTWSDEGYSIYYCEGSYLKFYTFLKSNDFELVFSTHLMMNALLGFFRNIGILKTSKLVCRESTIVFDRYNGVKLFRYKLAYFLGYNKIDLLITQSELMKARLVKELPYIDKRMNIKTINNLFAYPNSVGTVNVDFKFIVSAGRLIYEKGFDVLIKAFSKLKIDNPDLKLIILGDGVVQKDLVEMIDRLQLNNDVLLPGHVNDVYSYFKAAEMCVVSSRIEGFPNVLLQMMSQNNNVVSTLCAGGIDELKGVYTVAPDSVDELVLKMNLCLNSDNTFNKQLFSEILKKRSVENFFELIIKELN